MLYRYPLLSTGSVSLKIEISMSKMLLALRYIGIDTNCIVEKKEENRYSSSQQIAKKLNIHHSTLMDHSRKEPLGRKKNVDIWILQKMLLDQIYHSYHATKFSPFLSA